MEQYYIALVPEKKLINLIIQQKRLIEKEIGNQTYLHHPPHLTLIIFTTDNLNEIANVLQELTGNIKKFKIKLKDFHVFYNDTFAQGNNSITYSLSEENIEYLKKIQSVVVNSINQFNTKKFIDKESEEYKRMSEIEKQNIEKYGHPFVNENWIPHITLASIEPEKFNLIFEKLKQSPIQGEFAIDSINLYKVGEETSFLIKNFELR